MAQDDDVDVGRECIIKGLCVYLNEDLGNLVKEYVTGWKTKQMMKSATQCWLFWHIVCHLCLEVTALLNRKFLSFIFLLYRLEPYCIPLQQF
ncbi:hypothetical protein G5714_008267 [Onychostoma macrolepis]|uniref:Uncharacterized protein n=1 Tax=Onychostoma macrolepis TaxID=369639 RepID=A0A7J6CVA0_9TELE|nr:hypothetical protein G5714_008267 [Onychostoma macrolepis]